MKGGYQMVDLSGINFVTDAGGVVITDPEIVATIKDVITSKKPLLLYGFRGGHGPNFGSVYNSSASSEICVNTSIDPETGAFWAYSVVWKKSTDTITGYCKQYTLS